MGKTSLDDFESPHTASLKPGDEGLYELFCLCGVELQVFVLSVLAYKRDTGPIVFHGDVSYVCEEGHRLSFFSAVMSGRGWRGQGAFGLMAEKSHSRSWQ